MKQQTLSLRLLMTFGMLLSMMEHTCGFHQSPPNIHRQPFISAPAVLPSSTRTTTSRLLATKKSSKTEGVYARPSAAIERGSGFFIPGLEGPRVRSLFGVVILVLVVVNHFFATTSTISLEEGLAAVYGILLLLQAAIEFGKEEKGFVVTTTTTQPSQQQQNEAISSNSESSLLQRWGATATAANESWKEKVQWSAATYIALTPATTMYLIQDDEILYALGGEGEFDDAASVDIIKGCRAALETLSRAKSDRVALPSDHPCVVNLAPSNSRCFVLQTINENKCWMMTSNQLVQAFTKEDLKWLGQLASYVTQ